MSTNGGTVSNGGLVIARHILVSYESSVTLCSKVGWSFGKKNPMLSELLVTVFLWWDRDDPVNRLGW